MFSNLIGDLYPSEKYLLTDFKIHQCIGQVLFNDNTRLKDRELYHLRFDDFKH